MEALVWLLFEAKDHWYWISYRPRFRCLFLPSVFQAIQHGLCYFSNIPSDPVLYAMNKKG